MKPPNTVPRCLLFACVLLGAAGAADLAAEFAAPPATARIWTWWFWLGDRVDRASITADLEALKAQGVGGVTVYSLSGPGVPGQGPGYLTPPWVELFDHTLAEAERLGLGVSTMLCSGWNAGGPWITPEHACKRRVDAQLRLVGPRRFRGALPQPAADRRLYRDVAVQAFPVGDLPDGPTLSASTSHPRYPVTNAADGDPASFWVSNGERPDEGPNPQRPEWLRVDLGEPRVVRGVRFVPRPGYGPRQAEVQVSADGAAFTPVKALALGRDQAAECELPATPLRAVRLLITATWSPERENVQVCEVLLDGSDLRRGAPAALWAYKTLADSFGSSTGTPIHEVCAAPLRPLPPAAPGMTVDPARVVDLTARCGPDGVLDWEVPPGHWVVLRTGYTLTGAQTSWSGGGLEADPLDPAALDAQFARVVEPLLKVAGKRVGSVFRSVQIDSWEIGLPNWTPAFLAEFQRLRGYDARPWLAALAGWVVADAERTDRFLADYRKTVAECVAEHCFGRLSALAEARGLVQQSEAGGVCHPKVMALDALKNLGRCAIPMGEFWQDGAWVEANQNKNGKQTASAAHLYGRRIAAAEAFTSFRHWLEGPAALKPTADRAFAEGFNHFFIFSSATRSGETPPGTEFSAGTHFNRHVTWWPHARGFADYLARCSHLLQQGLFVADVLYYNGDACPNYVSPKHIDPALGAGYDYDVCNAEVLLERAAVKDGRLVLPDGMSYRLLVLPARREMPVEVVRKVRDLVLAGATVVGPRPATDPGLRDWPRCDEVVRQTAAQVWGEVDGQAVKERRVGAGRVIWGKSPRAVLAADGVPPDCAVTAPTGAFVDWLHRRSAEGEIYFLANRLARPEAFSATFRVSGRQPELWDPVTGSRRDLPEFTERDGCTTVPLALEPHGSAFVVFREPPRASAGRNVPRCATRLELAGPWRVTFDPRWFYPTDGLSGETAAGRFHFTALDDWARRAEPAVRHFSGTAVYQHTFTWPAGVSPEGASPSHLDLGSVKETALVRLNGQSLGLIWCAPWRVALGGALRVGENRLEIEVANLWPNRLLGDSLLPAEQRRTRTNIGLTVTRTPLSSGLLGPVRLVATGG